MTLLSQAAFARHIQRDKAHVTRLKQKGRLVMDGNRVDVEKSLALIASTAGTRDDVARRHAETRGQEGVPQGKAVELPGDDDYKASIREAQRNKQLAESRRVMALADQEEMERDRLAGSLIAREEADAAMKFVGAAIGSLLDVLPDQLAPVVAPAQSLDECREILAEACRNVRVRLGEEIERRKAELMNGVMK